jgi:hypothetical protein
MNDAMKPPEWTLVFSRRYPDRQRLTLFDVQIACHDYAVQIQHSNERQARKLPKYVRFPIKVFIREQCKGGLRTLFTQLSS